MPWEVEDEGSSSKRKKTLIVVGSVLLVLVAIGVPLYFSSSPPVVSEDTKLIDWRTLRQLNYRTGRMPVRLESLDGKRIRLPGFVVPLEDEAQMVKEFLFVPTMQACIHTPPPPPNQMLYVMMNEGFELSWDMRAYWLEGILQIAHKESPYGKVSYQLEGKKIEPYRPNY